MTYLAKTLNTSDFKSLLRSSFHPLTPVFSGSFCGQFNTKWRGVSADLSYNTYLRNGWVVIDTGVKSETGTPIIEFSSWEPYTSDYAITLPNVMSYRFFFKKSFWRVGFLTRTSIVANESWVNALPSYYSIFNNTQRSGFMSKSHTIVSLGAHSLRFLLTRFAGTSNPISQSLVTTFARKNTSALRFLTYDENKRLARLSEKVYFGVATTFALFSSSLLRRLSNKLAVSSYRSQANYRFSSFSAMPTTADFLFRLNVVFLLYGLLQINSQAKTFLQRSLTTLILTLIEGVHFSEISSFSKTELVSILVLKLTSIFCMTKLSFTLFLKVFIKFFLNFFNPFFAGAAETNVLRSAKFFMSTERTQAIFAYKFNAVWRVSLLPSYAGLAASGYSFNFSEYLNKFVPRFFNKKKNGTSGARRSNKLALSWRAPKRSRSARALIGGFVYPKISPYRKHFTSRFKVLVSKKQFLFLQFWAINFFSFFSVKTAGKNMFWVAARLKLFFKLFLKFLKFYTFTVKFFQVSLQESLKYRNEFLTKFKSTRLYFFGLLQKARLLLAAFFTFVNKIFRQHTNHLTGFTLAVNHLQANVMSVEQVFFKKSAGITLGTPTTSQYPVVALRALLATTYKRHLNTYTYSNVEVLVKFRTYLKFILLLRSSVYYFFSAAFRKTFKALALRATNVTSIPTSAAIAVTAPLTTFIGVLIRNRLLKIFWFPRAKFNALINSLQAVLLLKNKVLRTKRDKGLSLVKKLATLLDFEPATDNTGNIMLLRTKLGFLRRLLLKKKKAFKPGLLAFNKLNFDAIANLNIACANNIYNVKGVVKRRVNLQLRNFLKLSEVVKFNKTWFDGAVGRKLLLKLSSLASYKKSYGKLFINQLSYTRNVVSAGKAPLSVISNMLTKSIFSINKNAQASTQRLKSKSSLCSNIRVCGWGGSSSLLTGSEARGGLLLDAKPVSISIKSLFDLEDNFLPLTPDGVGGCNFELSYNFRVNQFSALFLLLNLTKSAILKIWSSSFNFFERRVLHSKLFGLFTRTQTLAQILNLRAAMRPVNIAEASYSKLVTGFNSVSLVFTPKQLDLKRAEFFTKARYISLLPMNFGGLRFERFSSYIANAPLSVFRVHARIAKFSAVSLGFTGLLRIAGVWRLLRSFWLQRCVTRVNLITRVANKSLFGRSKGSALAGRFSRFVKVSQLVTKNSYKLIVAARNLINLRAFSYRNSTRWAVLRSLRGLVTFGGAFKRSLTPINTHLSYSEKILTTFLQLTSRTSLLSQAQTVVFRKTRAIRKILLRSNARRIGIFPKRNKELKKMYWRLVNRGKIERVTPDYTNSLRSVFDRRNRQSMELASAATKRRFKFTVVKLQFSLKKWLMSHIASLLKRVHLTMRQFKLRVWRRRFYRIFKSGRWLLRKKSKRRFMRLIIKAIYFLTAINKLLGAKFTPIKAVTSLADVRAIGHNSKLFLLAFYAKFIRQLSQDASIELRSARLAFFKESKLLFVYKFIYYFFKKVSTALQVTNVVLRAGNVESLILTGLCTQYFSVRDCAKVEFCGPTLAFNFFKLNPELLTSNTFTVGYSSALTAQAFSLFSNRKMPVGVSESLTAIRAMFAASNQFLTWKRATAIRGISGEKAWTFILLRKINSQRLSLLPNTVKVVAKYKRVGSLTGVNRTIKFLKQANLSALIGPHRYASFVNKIRGVAKRGNSFARKPRKLRRRVRFKS